MLKVTVNDCNSLKLVKIEGRFDTNSSKIFDSEVEKILKTERYIILDMSLCEYLSSYGIRSLLIVEKQLRLKKGFIILVDLTPEVYQVIEMTGLQVHLNLCNNIDEAKKMILHSTPKKDQVISWSSFKNKFHFHRLTEYLGSALLWQNSGIVGYNELNFSIGLGCLAEDGINSDESMGIFVTSKNCAGVIPSNIEQPWDFRITKKPSEAGLIVDRALSFNTEPVGQIFLENSSEIQLNNFIESIIRNKINYCPESEDFFLIATIDNNPSKASLLFILTATIKQTDEFAEKGFDILKKSNFFSEEGLYYVGIKYSLLKNPDNMEFKNFSQALNNILSFENITNLSEVKPNELLQNPKSWIFLADNIAYSNHKRLKIETKNGIKLDTKKEFLIRRLYSDCSSLLLNPLHGGYSAQTFQVDSYDRDGRKLRPTVVKIADRKTIYSEAERCDQYALPYIINNSAIILGSEFFGKMGALRYNFVGVGGEASELKWLAYYYDNWSSEKLKPLFDKIFLKILKPWYGQPITEAIYPFQDHDPTFTFFQNLFHTAKEELGISSEEKLLKIEQIDEELINPYWFLRYEYPKHREWNMEYFKTICHGDLNMQNILLDEMMNVYLIDFSDTRPRSVVSDFARLEAIFIIDRAPVNTREELSDYINFVYNFYSNKELSLNSEYTYNGKNKDTLKHNYEMTLKVREYAINCTKGNIDPFPFYMALLEWIFPIVCYDISYNHKKLSMIAAAVLCKKVMIKLYGCS